MESTSNGDRIDLAMTSGRLSRFAFPFAKTGVPNSLVIYGIKPENGNLKLGLGELRSLQFDFISGSRILN